MPETKNRPPFHAPLYGLLLSLLIAIVVVAQIEDTTPPAAPSGATTGTQLVADPPPVRLPPTPLPTVTSAVTPAPTSGPSPTSAPSATPTVPPPTPEPTATPAIPESELSLSLSLLSPTEGAGVDIGAIRVFGLTRPDASVEVNQGAVRVQPDGTFQQDLLLEEGLNTVMAIASDLRGNSASKSVAVLFIPPASGVPLSVFYPNGLEVSEPEITVIGATRQDAVVGVNGVPVAVNALGIFTATVPLEEGANLVEVVAVDIDGLVNFQTVVVFYLPDSFRETYAQGN